MKRLVVLAAFLFSQNFAVEPGLNSDYSLNRDAIKKSYFDGDFEQVRKSLEEFRQYNPSPIKEDLIFVYKYLSVVYAADSKSRDKAESYMYQLLKIMPSVDLIDMFVSENIELIFKNVRSKYEKESKYRGEMSGGGPPPKNDSAQKPPPPKDLNSEDVPNNKKSKKWVYWAAGGGALVAVVIGYVALSPEENKSSGEKLGEF